MLLIFDCSDFEAQPVKQILTAPKGAKHKVRFCFSSDIKDRFYSSVISCQMPLYNGLNVTVLL